MEKGGLARLGNKMEGKNGMHCAIEAPSSLSLIHKNEVYADTFISCEIE